MHLIGLDTSVANSQTGNITDDQLDWLKKDLIQQNGEIILLASHHPLLPPAPFNSGKIGDQYLLPQGPAIEEILNGISTPIIALSGHIHISKIEQKKNVWYISFSQS